jgi:hypothetical protein
MSSENETTQGNGPRVWAAAIFPIGQAEVFGGMWDSDQLHWTRAAAVSEIEARVIETGLLPMEWTRAEGDLIIGRTHFPATNSGLRGDGPQRPTTQR